jgi:hypothetical protein
MDYLILTVRQKVQTTTGEIDSVGYVCVNSIARCVNAEGKDIIQFVCSGRANQVLIENVICITPSTPMFPLQK